jgi:hypothetical protein
VNRAAPGPLLTVLLALLTAGCSSVSTISALAVGGAAGGATASPAVGYAVGIGTKVAVDYAVKYARRVRQRAEQNAIADAAGDLEPGAAAAWHIDHTVPIDNEHGTVRVIRLIDNSLAACKELVFSVDADPPAPPAWFSTSICRRPQRWKWAAVEPAVQRWGYMQQGP